MNMSPPLYISCMLNHLFHNNSFHLMKIVGCRLVEERRAELARDTSDLVEYRRDYCKVVEARSLVAGRTLESLQHIDK